MVFHERTTHISQILLDILYSVDAAFPPFSFPLGLSLPLRVKEASSNAHLILKDVSSLQALARRALLHKLRLREIPTERKR